MLLRLFHESYFGSFMRAISYRNNLTLALYQVLFGDSFSVDSVVLARALHTLFITYPGTCFGCRYISMFVVSKVSFSISISSFLVDPVKISYSNHQSFISFSCSLPANGLYGVASNKLGICNSKQDRSRDFFCWPPVTREMQL